MDTVKLFQEKLADVSKAAKAGAKNEIGPVEANRLILEMTGGKGMCEVKDQYAVILEALAKAK
jgi:hypothetical protein